MSVGDVIQKCDALDGCAHLNMFDLAQHKYFGHRLTGVGRLSGWVSIMAFIVVV